MTYRASFPDELIDVLARRIARALPAAPIEPFSPWLYGTEQLANYLGWPLGRAEKWANRIPHRKVGGRNQYVKAEVDAFILEFPDPTGWSSRRSTSVPSPRGGA